MSHRCDAACLELKRFLRQGSGNGVWEFVFQAHNHLLVEAAEVCPDVEVISIGNLRRFLLREANPSTELSTLGAAAAAAPLTPKTPSQNAVSGPRPNETFSFSDALSRVEVSWFEKNANVFYVHDVEATHKFYLPQIEETLRYLRGAQTPLPDDEFVVGARAIVRARDVGDSDNDGWTRVEIKRVDSDGALVTCVDYGNQAKLPNRALSVIPRFVSDYPPQAYACRLMNTAHPRHLWTPDQSGHFESILKLCNSVLYSREPLRNAFTTNSALLVVDFYVKIPKPVSAADAIYHLEHCQRINYRPPSPRLSPIAPASPAANAESLDDDYDRVEPIAHSLATCLALSPPPLDARPIPFPPSPVSLETEPPAASSPPDAPLPPDMSLPKAGEWVSVFVPIEFHRFSIRPNYFIVRPAQYGSQFETSMKTFAEEMGGAPRLNASDVVKGGCYAAFLDNGSNRTEAVRTWMRVVVIDVKESAGTGEWKVFCGDLGTWASASYEDLRLLPDAYRASPFQAITARLDVEPARAETDRYHADTFQFLNDQMKEESGLSVLVKEIRLADDSWPRVELTLSSLMREDREECVIGALVKRNLVKRAGQN